MPEGHQLKLWPLHYQLCSDDPSVSWDSDRLANAKWKVESKFKWMLLTLSKPSSFPSKLPKHLIIYWLLITEPGCLYLK